MPEPRRFSCKIVLPSPPTRLRSSPSVHRKCALWLLARNLVFGLRCVDHNIDWAEVTGLKDLVVIAHFMAPDADRALQLLESPAFRDALSASGATGRAPVTYARDVVIAIRSPRRLYMR